MTAISHVRGHKVKFCDGDWYFCDNNQLSEIDRACIRCNRMPTDEGHDACLGELPGVCSACCGHGVTEPYLITRPRPDDLDQLTEDVS